jgi:hypothetical protein
MMHAAARAAAVAQELHHTLSPQASCTTGGLLADQAECELIPRADFQGSAASMCEDGHAAACIQPGSPYFCINTHDHH